ncbi:MAG: hypothetical protein HOJ87_03150 [Rhodospirillaceae bacterium]|nr:hypothetical protein [Rhodospirillaceae bacterium]
MKWNKSKIPFEETYSLDLGFASDGYGGNHSRILVKTLVNTTNDDLGALCPDCTSLEELRFQTNRIRGELDKIDVAAAVEYEASRD